MGIFEEVVTSLLTKFGEDILETCIKTLEEREGLSGMVKKTSAKSNAFVLKLIKMVVEREDAEFCQKRNIHKVLKYHTYRAKNILTPIGNIELCRNEYLDKDSGKRFVYVDDILDLDKRQRIDKLFQGEIVKSAVEHSYRTASALAGGMVTPMTAYNLVKRYHPKQEEVFEEEIGKKKE